MMRGWQQAEKGVGTPASSGAPPAERQPAERTVLLQPSAAAQFLAQQRRCFGNSSAAAAAAGAVAPSGSQRVPPRPPPYLRQRHLLRLVGRGCDLGPVHLCSSPTFACAQVHPAIPAPRPSWTLLYLLTTCFNRELEQNRRKNKFGRLLYLGVPHIG